MISPKFVMFYVVLLIVYALSLDVIELQEFYRLRSSLRAKKEHASLLDNFKEFDRTRLDLEEGGESEQHTLLKEHASISRNTGHVSHIK
jgi:hypothetical protein